MIDLRQLPVPPARLCQVVQATQDPDVPMGKIVRLVASDPGLTVELLRIANSAYYSPRRKILSVAQATVFLGLRAVRHHAVSHVLKAVIDQVDLSGVDERRLWKSIVYRGAAAHVIAELLGYDDPTEAFTTGVIMDSGFVMLVAMRPEHASALDRAARWPGPRAVGHRAGLVRHDPPRDLRSLCAGVGAAGGAHSTGGGAPRPVGVHAPEPGSEAAAHRALGR